MNLKKLFSRKPTAAKAQSDQMPSTTSSRGVSLGARPLTNPAWLGGYTPERVADILSRVEAGDDGALNDYFRLADAVIERELHSAGVINGLVLAIAGLEHKATPRKNAKNSEQAQEIADAVQELLDPSSALRGASVGIISQGVTHGIGVASVVYEVNESRWTPIDFIQKPAHFFSFDRSDGRTPLLRDLVSGQDPAPIPEGLAIAFAPRRNSHMQVKNGLAWILCWAYVMKSIVLANELTFLEMFGHPAILGRFDHGASEEDKNLLQRAVSGLSGTFRGVFRRDLEIEFKEIARSDTDLYEKVCRYIDEQVSKVVWASTLTTDAGGGGTYALGKVHAEGKYDVIRTYASQWAASLQLFVDNWVLWNFGEDAPSPLISVDVEEAEDLAAAASIVASLAAAGVKLDANEIRRKFGFSDPAEGAETIGGAIATAGFGAFSRNNNGDCPVHSSNAASTTPPHDALDSLADNMADEWVKASSEIDAALLAAALASNSLEDMRSALLAVIEKGVPSDAMTALFTKERTKARLAGNQGVQL